jgi:acetyltransferase-like isoleucine patch superfamily enzyme
MLRNKINTLAFRLGSIKDALRRSIWQFRGLTIGQNCTIDNFDCSWPMRVKIGARCKVEAGVSVKINHPFSSGYALELSDDVFIGRGCDFNISSSIKIGRGVLVAAHTIITDTGHAMAYGTPIFKQTTTTASIEIGDGAWIGAGVIILPGVKIGRDAVVGAGSIVTKSIPENEIWAGTPAKKIKNRT